MKLLHIDSSILGTASVSRQLTERIAAQWRATHPGTTVDYLDLVISAPGHLSAQSLGFRLPAGADGLTDASGLKTKCPKHWSASSWRPM
jgi:FMN-dependent NADH-azoreductase